MADKRTEYDEAVAISAEMTKWWNDVDEYLDSSSSTPLSMSANHRITLIVLRHESVIALNKHVLATSKNVAAYNAALQNCIGAARSIISTLHGALPATIDSGISQPPIESASNSGLLWPSFTWAIWMSTFLIIYAANEEQVSQDVAIR